MKTIVQVINVFSREVVETHEFDEAADALEYAVKMNVLMNATPLLYQVIQ